MQLLCTGLCNAEIAARLALCEKTVRNHVTNIFGKLNVNSRAQAIVKGLELGLAMPVLHAGAAHRAAA
jgi:DNA-binding NarL/FixJ family response regulator